ncbi:nuclear transport factor 2 family protein [Mycobacterium sp.]|uniref:nuclear transport factor 2 family protein n=1 Tax=Mycobacterium sp. TaxID=1785 RepID=UPI00333F195E|nr:ketosteroid isomerase-like protein [Mycobacterium sp.]
MNDTTTVVDDGEQSHAVDTVARQRVVRAMFDALDRGDIEQMVRYMTDDVVTSFGNFPELNGKAAFDMMFRDVAKSVSGVRHDIHDLWQVEQDADLLVARMTVAYTRHDGSTISLPCCNVFRMRANLVSHYSVYVDITPVLPAPTQTR